MPRRRLRMAAAAFLLASGGVGVGTAHADNVSQICKSVPNTGISHGACVSLAQAGNPTALISAVCADPAAQQALGTTNRGQCLKAARALLP